MNHPKWWKSFLIFQFINPIMSEKNIAVLTEIAKIAEGKSIEDVDVGLLSAKQKRKLKKAIRQLNAPKTKGEDLLGTLSLWLQIDMITHKLEWADEAIISLEMILHHNPTEDMAWSRLANLLVFQHRYKEAEEVYKTMLQHEPTSYVVWFTQGMFYGKLQRFREAEESFRTATRHNPTHINSWIYLSKTLVSLRKYEEAEECSRSGLHHNPTNGLAWYDLGAVLYGNGKYGESLESFKKALSFAPPDEGSFIPTVNQAIIKAKQEWKKKKISS
jgi:tetratricopeptide (TPR) repeat protein